MTDKQKQKLQNELLSIKGQLQKTESETDIKNQASEDTGELSMYDNHPADMGTELYEREKDIALNTHAEGQLDKVNNALQAIDEGTYGMCEVCSKEIGYERLEAIPYSTTCIDHAEQDVPDDRPVEDDLLIMANPDTFADRREGIDRDPEDSFQEIAKSGTSETPSDFTGDHADYNSLYDAGQIEEPVEDVEAIAGNDITGKVHGYVRSDTTEEYEETLDEEQLESPIGNIPYEESDSYIEDTGTKRK